MKKTKKLKYIYKIIIYNNYRSIGIAVDRKEPNLSNIPITSFYFWPREDVWNLLKSDLQKNLLISFEDQDEILNGYINIILHWSLSLEDDLQSFNKFHKLLNFNILGTI